ncbi:MAG: glycosyltransferase family 39 protein [Thermoguttaceae bacterium]
MSSKTAAIWFWTVLVFFSLCWILLPAFLHSGYKLDTVELQFIAKEWTLSTKKHPMLPAWLLEVVNILTNRAFAAPFIAAQFCVGLALWAVWRFARTVLPEQLALLATFAMFPYWFFTIESIKYNQNSVLLSFWALILLFSHLAFQTNRLPYWIGTGFFIGCALHTKYSILFLVLAILFAMILDRRNRQLWLGIGPYLTLLIAFLLFLPHLIWLYQHDFATIEYAESRPVLSTGGLTSFFPIEFLLSELAYLITPVIILLPVLGLHWKRKRKTDVRSDARLLILCSMLIPLGIHIVLYSFFRIELNTDYGAPFWLFFGVWLLLEFQPRWSNPRERECPLNADQKPKSITQCKEESNGFRRSIQLLFATEIIMIAFLLFQSLLAPYLTGKVSRTHYPMQQLGKLCDAIWYESFSIPCPYLTGEWWTAGNAAISMKDRPTVLFYDDSSNLSNLSNSSISSNTSNSSNSLNSTNSANNNDSRKQSALLGTWVNEADMHAKGGMILWEIHSRDENGTRYEEGQSGEQCQIPRFFAERFPDAQLVPNVFELSYNTGATIPPIQIGVAIISPKPKPENKN